MKAKILKLITIPAIAVIALQLCWPKSETHQVNGRWLVHSHGCLGYFHDGEHLKHLTPKQLSACNPYLP